MWLAFQLWYGIIWAKEEEEHVNELFYEYRGEERKLDLCGKILAIIVHHHPLILMEMSDAFRPFLFCNDGIRGWLNHDATFILRPFGIFTKRMETLGDIRQSTA